MQTTGQTKAEALPAKRDVHHLPFPFDAGHEGACNVQEPFDSAMNPKPFCSFLIHHGT